MKTKLHAWLGASAALSVLAACLSTSALAAEKATATGTWKWSSAGQNGQTRESTLKLKQDGEKLTGAMIGRNDTETPIKEGKIKESVVTFKVVRERNGQEFTTSYKGKLEGDTIKGTIGTERDGQARSREWEAKRGGDVAGTWKWTITTPNGQTFEPTLKLKMEGGQLTGMMIRNDRETPIEEAKVKDGEISFQVTRERNGEKFVSKYQGKLSGDAIKGKISTNFGGEDRTFDWDAKRQKAE